MTTHCELCGRELSTFRAINNTPICSRCERAEEPYPSVYHDDRQQGCEVIYLADNPFFDPFYDSLESDLDSTTKDKATS